MPVRNIAILHYAAPPIVGGVELTIYHHARLLAARGYTVHVIAGRGEPFLPQVHFHHIPEVDSRHPEVLAIHKALARGEVPPAFALLRDRIVEQLTPLLQPTDITVVHNAMTLHKNLPLTAALHTLATERGVRFIAWCHDFAWADDLYLPEMHTGYPWDLLRTRWPSVCYVVVSEHRRQQLAELLNISPQEIHVIPPGVDIAEFFKLEPETRRLIVRLDLLHAAPLVLLPARITRRKNIEFALRVMGALVERMPEATLIVTGPPGPHNPTNVAYLNALRALRQNLGIEKRVHFLYEHGEKDAHLHVTDAMMSDLYQLADVLLFPSKREGFGIPILEAGLARIPIFAAHIPPVQESAGSLAYRFAPEDDPALVAQMIAEHLSRDRVYQMRKRVLTHYRWDAILEHRILPLFEQCAHNATNSPSS